MYFAGAQGGSLGAAGAAAGGGGGGGGSSTEGVLPALGRNFTLLMSLMLKPPLEEEGGGGFFISTGGGGFSTGFGLPWGEEKRVTRAQLLHLTSCTHLQNQVGVEVEVGVGLHPFLGHNKVEHFNLFINKPYD